jgi:hypothetical protein
MVEEPPIVVACCNGREESFRGGEVAGRLSAESDGSSVESRGCGEAGPENPSGEVEDGGGGNVVVVTGRPTILSTAADDVENAHRAIARKPMLRKTMVSLDIVPCENMST